MIRDTSLSAYHQTADLRATCKAQILEVVKSTGRMTRRQIAKETGLETSCVSGRVRELLDCGLLKELEMTGKCPVTDRLAHWVTA